MIFLVLFSRIKGRITRRKPIITIFGSCRQDSLYSHFKITKIRNGLTYPHFSKEVLQAIKYCTYEDSTKTFERWIFRNAVIGKKILSRKKLQREMKKTNIFIIEIASLIEYRYKNFYLHHELYDSYENISQKIKNVVPLKAEIEVRKQTKTELISDLQEIVKILGKNRLVFATHFSTRPTGQRTELINTLMLFCLENSISVFNPSEMLEFYLEDQIFEKEKVLSHFTPLGHELAGYRLKEIIQRTYNSHLAKSKFIIQKLEKPMAIQDGFASGYGDFLYGAAKIFEISKKFGLYPGVDFSETALDRFYKSKIKASSQVVTKIYHHEPDTRFYRPNYVFTNKRPNLEFGLELRDFILRNCLEKRISYSNFVASELRKFSVDQKDYVVMHIRVDDLYDLSPDKKISNFIKTTCLEIKNRESREVIAISNSNLIRGELTQLGISVPKLTPTHSSDPNVSPEDQEGTFFEFEMMGSSKTIYSLSTYSWGSGFSAMASLIFSVPLIRIEIPIE